MFGTPTISIYEKYKGHTSLTNWNYNSTPHSLFLLHNLYLFQPLIIIFFILTKKKKAFHLPVHFNLPPPSLQVQGFNNGTCKKLLPEQTFYLLLKKFTTLFLKFSFHNLSSHLFSIQTCLNIFQFKTEGEDGKSDMAAAAMRLRCWFAYYCHVLVAS